ncbi:MAG TPA: DUF362 domain-containing protein [Candidatus Acidoferrales bacterium]|nr:DUF362 domain-containing protein [Candidatus Acidoferrales bacterium]
MDRRTFVTLAAAAPLAAAPIDVPAYRVVTPFPKSQNPGMPGPYPGQAVRVHSEKSIDPASGKVDLETVRKMLSTGMRALTGDTRDDDAWARFVSPKDTVGIKVNCSGAPRIRSSPEVVGAIAERVMAVGVPAERIWIYERFMNQLVTVPYRNFVPQAVHIHAAETDRGSVMGYDPKVYVETDFFGEEDTRSNLTRIVSETLTKIINVPNMKEHQASGVTGCLKNIAYGNFSNVARSHRNEKTNTYSFIGTLAAVEPVRSRVVLAVMDGLAGVWHAGPFSNNPRFRFYPKELMIGTDPVAMDRQLIDIIEAKRKAEGAISIFNQSREILGDNRDPNKNAYIREPGHVEYASKLGLGVYDQAKIQVKRIEL